MAKENDLSTLISDRFQASQLIYSATYIARALYWKICVGETGKGRADRLLEHLGDSSCTYAILLLDNHAIFPMFF